MELQLGNVNSVKKTSLSTILSVVISLNTIVFLTFLLVGRFAKTGVYHYAVVGALYELL